MRRIHTLTRAALGALLLLACVVPLAGCSARAEAAAEARADREVRRLRTELERLGTRLDDLQAANAKLEKQLTTLRETSFVTSSGDGVALRINAGAAAVFIVLILGLVAVRITHIRHAARPADPSPVPPEPTHAEPPA